MKRKTDPVKVDGTAPAAKKGRNSVGPTPAAATAPQEAAKVRKAPSQPKAKASEKPSSKPSGKAGGDVAPTRQKGRNSAGPQPIGAIAEDVLKEMSEAITRSAQQRAASKKSDSVGGNAGVAKAAKAANTPAGASCTNPNGEGQKSALGQVIASKRPPRKGKLLCDSRAGDGGSASATAPDASLLPFKWQLFVNEYMVDLNGKQAAIRAGYSPNRAHVQASELLARPDVCSVVQAMMDDRIERIKMTRERVLAEFENIADADANELSELRRVCCRHCWGEIDPETEAQSCQFTPAEFVAKKAKWDADRERRLNSKGGEDIGDFPFKPGNWYDKRKPINERCTECFGDGVQDVFLKDTRDISRRARAIYGGVKEGKDGIEIKTYSKEAALQVLAKHHKLYDESPTLNLNIAPAELEDIYAKGMEGVQKAKDAVVGRGEKIRGEKRAG